MNATINGIISEREEVRRENTRHILNFLEAMAHEETHPEAQAALHRAIREIYLARVRPFSQYAKEYVAFPRLLV